MAVSKAQQAAVNKYIKNNYDRLNITIAKGSKSMLEAAARADNDSSKRLSRLNMKQIQAII